MNISPKFKYPAPPIWACVEKGAKLLEQFRHAQQALGDIALLELAALAVIKSLKAASGIYAQRRAAKLPANQASSRCARKNQYLPIRRLAG